MSKLFWCCSAGFEGAVFSLLALDVRPMGSFIESAMVASTKDIAYFVTDTAAYVVSKMWDDLLGGLVFKMTTVFLCSPAHHRPCNQPADVEVQLRYCFVVVVVCALIKTHVERYFAKQNRGSLVIPGMLGMLVGWTFGRAFQQMRRVLEARVLGCAQWGQPMHVAASDFNLMYIITGVAPESTPISPDGGLECEVLASSGHTTTFRVLYALAITLISSLLILLLEPAAALETFGSSAWRRRVGVRFTSLVQLLSKAAATTSMILWNDALTGGATADILPEQETVRIRMLLFYSMAMTFGGSAVSIQFQDWSKHLTALAEEAAKAAAEEADKKRQLKAEADQIEAVLSQLSEAEAPEVMEADGLRRRGGSAPSPQAPPVDTPVSPGTSQPRSQERFARMLEYGGSSASFLTSVLHARSLKATRSLTRLGSNIAALRLRIHFIAASLRTLAVLEATLGWVAGCAWTAYTVAVYPTIGAFPDTWWVVFANVRVALLLSVLAIAWITFTGNNSGGRSGERESRERLFIGGAFSFFSGWAWISVVRCIWVMPYALMPAHIQHSGTDVDLRHLYEMILSLVFCPVATWLVIRAALATKNAYEKRAGIGTWRRHVNAIRAFTRARAKMNQTQSRVSSRLPEVLL